MLTDPRCRRNAAVKALIVQAIAAAHRLGKPIGICGQAPSDYPEFAEWLVEQGIDSMALNPDVAIATAQRVAIAEIVPRAARDAKTTHAASKAP